MGSYCYVEEVKRDAAYDYMRRVRANLHYIMRRPGRDYDGANPRRIFDANKNDVKTEFVLAAVEKQPLTQISAYLVTLSPNAYHFDCQRLVRYVFREYRIVRGVELEWFAGIHNNCYHSHAHIIILPTDARDRSFFIYYLDLHLIRYLANQWLERHGDVDRRSAS